jgi:hypothetical protein
VTDDQRIESTETPLYERMILLTFILLPGDAGTHRHKIDDDIASKLRIL